MKLLSSLTIAFFLGFSGLAQAEEGSIPSKDAWLETATSLIQDADFETLEEKCKETLGASMHQDVEDLLDPLQNAMQDHKAIYIDKINHVEMGNTFDQHIYAAYYGEREFVFYAFTFARLENGWQLLAIDFADSLGGLSPAVN